MQTYEAILQHIFNAFPMYHRVGTSAYKEGLENIEALAEMTQHPEKRFKAVHIAGTNGKGSVAHLLASYCQELGLKTALFTSPHLVDFRERIKINGENISQDEVVNFFERYEEPLKRIQPSFFEVTTILAFDYFAAQKVDIAIVEVGLGGRLDATNILTPLLSIITNISLEHTQLLGDTCAKIAFEKGGIIKSNVPVVVGEYSEETLPVFEKLACEKSAPLFLSDAYAVEVEEESMTHFLINLFCNQQPLALQVNFPLPGGYELKNIRTFLTALPILNQYIGAQHFPIREALENVVQNTHLMGRWQVVNDAPFTICDVGHNPAGLQNTMLQLQQLSYRKIHFLVGFVNDKDLESIIPILPKDAFYYLCRASVERALSPEVLGDIFAEARLNYVVGSDVAATYNLLKFNVKKDELVFVGGSCFVVGDFLKAIQNKEILL